jgi:hypothetical protein
VEGRSRRPALLDAHDAKFGGVYKLGFKDTAFAIEIKQDTQEQENTSENSGTATAYLLLTTYLPPNDRC